MSEEQPKVSQSKKGGRPRKGRTGLPQVNMIDAIKYTKNAFAKIGATLKSFAGMAEAMGLTEAFAKRAFGELRDYGLIEQENSGWRITNLGKRVVQSDENATIEILVKNEILQDLFNKFKDETVAKDYLEDYIKKRRYRYNINASLVADRFLEAINYLKKLGGEYKPDHPSEPKAEWFKVIQLNYALNPPTDKGVENLAKQVIDELGNSEDGSMKALSKQMKQHIGKPAELKIVVNSILHILNQTYPNLVLNPEVEVTPKTKHEVKKD